MKVCGSASVCVQKKFSKKGDRKVDIHRQAFSSAVAILDSLVMPSELIQSDFVW